MMGSLLSWWLLCDFAGVAVDAVAAIGVAVLVANVVVVVAAVAAVVVVIGVSVCEVRGVVVVCIVLLL